jgi:hypothetical protein
VIYHPQGAAAYDPGRFRKGNTEAGLQLVIGPNLKLTLKRSGHYDNYRDKMYHRSGGAGYGIKPMNCLAHMLIYKSGSAVIETCRGISSWEPSTGMKSRGTSWSLRVRGSPGRRPYSLCPINCRAKLRILRLFTMSWKFSIPLRTELSTGRNRKRSAPMRIGKGNRPYGPWRELPFLPNQ